MLYECFNDLDLRLSLKTVKKLTASFSRSTILDVYPSLSKTSKLIGYSTGSGAHCPTNVEIRKFGHTSCKNQLTHVFFCVSFSFRTVSLSLKLFLCDMHEKSEVTNITEDEAALYDRQIRLWGLDAQRRYSTCFHDKDFPSSGIASSGSLY